MPLPLRTTWSLVAFTALFLFSNCTKEDLSPSAPAGDASALIRTLPAAPALVPATFPAWDSMLHQADPRPANEPCTAPDKDTLLHRALNERAARGTASRPHSGFAPSL